MPDMRSELSKHDEFDDAIHEAIFGGAGLVDARREEARTDERLQLDDARRKRLILLGASKWASTLSPVGFESGRPPFGVDSLPSRDDSRVRLGCERR